MKQIDIFIWVLSLTGCIGNANSPVRDSEGIHIMWNPNSMRQLADKGTYPRLLRLKDNSIMVVFENLAGSIVFKRSDNDGLSWSEATEVFSRFIYTDKKGNSIPVNTANPEIIQLSNGHIILGCNYRPVQEEMAPYSIVIRRSTDNGKTWLPPQILYNAAPRFRDGCWEPSFLELPDGELQLYFANETPYQHSDEQEISMLTSPDAGESWTSKPKTISFRENKRDGMPVAAIVGDEIVVVIEDNKSVGFKPYTVRTKLRDNWKIPVEAYSPNREYALSETIPDSVYLGAPYLLKLPTGETLISYQSNENRSSNWEYSVMEVAIGDKTARNFSRRTQPFKVPLNKSAKWNSIALWNDSTVVALTSSDFNSEAIAPWMMIGHIKF